MEAQRRQSVAQKWKQMQLPKLYKHKCFVCEDESKPKNVIIVRI